MRGLSPSCFAVFALAAACALAAITPGAARATCDPAFLPRTDLGLLQSPALKEASGIAASRQYPGVLWTHNDSGDLARVFALNAHGGHLGIYTIAGASNRDWEDITTGPGPEPGRSYLYIGDIGDNSAVYVTKYVYRLPEPAADSSRAPHDTTVAGAERIAFEYPDGRRDAETLMVDPLTRDIYVVSKRESAVRVYRAAYPQAVGPVIMLEDVAMLPLASVVGGNISPTGREIVMKTYDQVYHWCREEGQTVAGALATTPVVLPYVPEPQGEAITWSADGRDYYTASEEAGGVDAHLYVYRRALASSVGFSDKDEMALPGPALSPNPFRISTTIRYSLVRPGLVALTVHTVDGRFVRRLAAEWQSADVHTFQWDGCDDAGMPAAAGVFLCTLITPEGTRATRIVKIR